MRFILFKKNARLFWYVKNLCYLKYSQFYCFKITIMHFWRFMLRMNRTGVTDSSDLRSTINTHVCIYVYDIRFWSVGKVFRGQRLMAEVKLIEYLKWSNKDVFSKNKGRNIGRKLIVQTQVYRSKYNLF